MVPAEVPDLSPKRVLVVHVSRIGDTLLATPALRAIAQAWPRAEITVLGHPRRIEVLANLPFLNDIGPISKRSASWRGWFGKDFDLTFVYGFDEPLVAYGLRAAARVVAFRQANQRLNTRLYRMVEPPPFQSEHSVRQLLRLPAAVGIQSAGLRVAYAVTEAEAAMARTRLVAAGGASRKPLIGLQVASFPTKAYRDWPVENFASLCNLIARRWPDCHFLIFGGGEERQRTSWLHERLGSRASMFAGQLSLRDTAGLMGLLDLYVGVDTGPTHLMSAFDIPLVGLYHGFSRSELIAPLEHPCFYPVDHPLAGPGCPTEAPMADISVETVFAQVQRALAEHPPKPT
jgi:heptosyltransferase-3